VNWLCELAGVSRAGYYRFRRRRPASAESMDLRNEIQQIALRWPAYGYRRIHAELVRGGWKVNHKCVLRLMRIDNLLCVRRRKFQQDRAEHHIAILPTFAALDVKNHALAVHVADLQASQLRVANASRVESHEHGAIKGSGSGVDELLRMVGRRWRFLG
jgi:putative transposase